MQDFYINQLPEEKIAAKVAVVNGPLAGWRIAAKDNICTKDFPTTCASKMMGEYMSPYNATVINRLEQAGAVITGKTNMDEFAMGCTGERSFFGPVKNPVNQSHAPGGSSSGSAAAVAAGVVRAALGSDTGGSIRGPAAHCGVVGFKPSYGVVSRYGLVACASSMDQIGPIARSVADCAAVMQVIAGHDIADAMTLDIPIDFTLNGEIKGKRIALPKECFGDDVSPDVKARVLEAIEVFQQLGAVVEEISLPLLKYVMPTYQILCCAEASSNLACFDGVKLGHRAENIDSLGDMYCKSRGEGFGEEVVKRILLGTTVLSSGCYDIYYKKAMQVRTLIKAEFEKTLERYDAIVTPTAPYTAPRFGEEKAVNADIFTAGANLAGLPALSVPCGGDAQGLPVGLQIIGAHMADAAVLNIGAAYEGGAA